MFMRVPRLSIGLSVLRAKPFPVSSYFIPSLHQSCCWLSNHPDINSGSQLIWSRAACTRIQLHNQQDNEMSTTATSSSKTQFFGKFEISSNQIFYTSPSLLTIGLVNLRPIVPGHVLVIPKRVAPRLSDLTPSEHADLWSSVQTVQSMLERHYHKSGGEEGGFNVAVQDGRVAGQSVPHVHVHILPRVGGNFERNDDVYDELEGWAPSLVVVRVGKGKQRLAVPEDEDRKDRTVQEMEEEARLYRHLLGPTQEDT